MTTSLSDLVELTPEVRASVEYHPSWPDDYHFFVDSVSWPRARELVEGLKRRYGSTGFDYVGHGHPFRDRPGYRFGSTDVAFEVRLARLLEVEPVEEPSEVPSTVEVAPTAPSVLRRRGRPPSNVSLVPLDRLRRRGDSLYVVGSVGHGTLRARVVAHGQEHDRRYACHTVSGGILVVLLEGRGVGEAEHKVEV